MKDEGGKRERGESSLPFQREVNPVFRQSKLMAWSCPVMIGSLS